METYTTLPLLVYLLNLFFFGLAWLGKYKEEPLQGAANFSYHGNIWVHGCQGNVIASNKVGNEEQKELVYENKTIGYLIIVTL